MTFWTRPACTHGWREDSQGSGDVAIDSEGRIFVAWNDHRIYWGGLWFSYGDIAAVVYDPSGLPTGADFMLNSNLNGPQYGPAVAALPGGGFLAVWTDAEYTESGDIKGQVVLSDGTFEGENFLVTQGREWYWACVLCEPGWDPPCLPGTEYCRSTAEPYNACVSVGPTGRWVTLWQDGTFPWYQVFDGRTPCGISRKVGEEVYGGWFDVAIGERGDFKILLLEYSRLLLFVYDEEGGFVGTRDLGVRVADDPFSAGPGIARDARGRFVVVWTHGSVGGHAPGISAQLFRWEDSEALGPAFPVQADPGGLGRRNPDVAMDSAGNFIVVYQVDQCCAAGQRFLADGTPYGHEFTGGGAYGSGLKVAMNDSGRVAITWSTGWPGDQKVRVYDFWAPDFIRGDVSGEGEVNLTDAIAIARYLFSPGSPPPVHPDAADTNDDGEQDIADVVYLLLHLYVGRPTVLPPPYPHWGFDTTEDALGS